MGSPKKQLCNTAKLSSFFRFINSLVPSLMHAISNRLFTLPDSFFPTSERRDYLLDMRRDRDVIEGLQPRAGTLYSGLSRSLHPPGPLNNLIPKHKLPSAGTLIIRLRLGDVSPGAKERLMKFFSSSFLFGNQWANGPMSCFICVRDFGRFCKVWRLGRVQDGSLVRTQRDVEKKWLRQNRGKIIKKI
ncbi:hypothetical protein CEXT_450801 [Caerostris extrusa]|uniref:Uncharacterized protein n=1 Tax=Caerostris extrusa TaxID=172846 RepID=A0AAV4WHZ2_CAEEX|nr:hypothetical protein CEXT_450801 [Caerostris extrusa]